MNPTEAIIQTLENLSIAVSEQNKSIASLSTALKQITQILDIHQAMIQKLLQERGSGPNEGDEWKRN